jgi:glycosyltransferase involved in cell wall biosynthesis
MAYEPLFLLMNILFINYGESHNNSAHQIHGFARELGRRGHDCMVAAVKSVPNGEMEAREGFRLASHKTVQACGGGFLDGQPAEVLHAWTPREGIRLFVEKYRQKWGAKIPLVLHLEDDEEVIFERFTGRSFAELQALPQEEWEHLAPPALTHPLRGPAFMAEASAFTVIYQSVAELVPPGKRWLEIPPLVDASLFQAGARDGALAEELGVLPSDRVIGYYGNDHGANVSDTRELYEVVNEVMSLRENVKFIRAGLVDEARYEGLDFRKTPRCRELGFVNHDRMPDLMRMADIFIQPGANDAFNHHRLPAKVPEFLLMAKPLIVGEANIGIELKESGAAVVLPEMSPPAMLQAVLDLLDHPESAADLGRRGREYILKRFDAVKVGDGLEALYRGL